jgi:N-acyl-D-glutamate deacylase
VLLREAFLIALILSSFSPSAPDMDTELFDCVIANGRVIDPESKLDAVRSIGIKDGKIMALSEGPLQGKEEIDAKGSTVAAGLIDLHSHAQTITGMRMQAFDGVTTALELEAGSWPISLGYQTAARQGQRRCCQ